MIYGTKCLVLEDFKSFNGTVKKGKLLTIIDLSTHEGIIYYEFRELQESYSDEKIKIKILHKTETEIKNWKPQLRRSNKI